MELVGDLMDLIDIYPEKISLKNRPTFVYKKGNRLFKASLASEHEKVALHSESHNLIRQKMSERLEIKTVTDFPELC